MIRKISILIIFVVLFYAQQIFADTVYLRNGNRLRGIITKETDKSVELKINPGAKVTFSKDDIKSIEKESEGQTAKLEEEWNIEKNKTDVKGMTKDIFEEEQLKKGLVKYKDEWMSAEEKERLQAASLARDADKGSGERRFSLKDDNITRSNIAKKLLSKGNWFSRESEHFYIFYRDLIQAKIVGDKAEYYFEKVIYDLGYEKDLKWDKKCQVFIVESVDKWKDFLKSIGFNADLIGGFVPNYAEKEMFLCAISEGYLALTFPHELTHLIFKEIAGKNGYFVEINESVTDAGWVIGVECEDFYKAAISGTRVSLVPTGFGTKFFQWLFPKGEILA